MYGRNEIIETAQNLLMKVNILDFSRHGSIVFYISSCHGNSKSDRACFVRNCIVTAFYIKFNFFLARRNAVFSRGETVFLDLVYFLILGGR